MRVAYYRGRTAGESIEVQQRLLGGSFDKEFSDDDSGEANRTTAWPGFSDMLRHVREGDTVSVVALYCLGRNAVGVRQTLATFADRGVILDVHGFGRLVGDVATLVFELIDQFAEMEREGSTVRSAANLETYKGDLTDNGQPWRGKKALKRRDAKDPARLAEWRRDNAASIEGAAAAFGLSTATVKRCYATPL